MERNPTGLPKDGGGTDPDNCEEIAQMLRRLEEADLDSGEAWRRNDMLQIECDLWQKRLAAEKAVRTAMEKSFSWWVTTPFRELDRMQARLRRSLAKRLAKLRKRPLPESGAAPALPNEDARERGLITHVPNFSGTSFLNGPATPARPRLHRDSMPQIAIYFSSSGNYFFQEIALLLHAAVSEAGFRSAVRTDAYGADPDADFHLIVAPHEFFILGKGSACFHRSLADRMFFLNTEQPQTKWFQLAKSMFPYVRHVFDMDRQTAQVIQSSGHSASHLPLGYVEDFAPYSTDADLLIGPETEALSADIRRWRDTDKPLADRPIDLSFVGEATARRSAFFASVAPLLANYECHLRLMPAGSGPWPARGIQTHRRTRTTAGLSQRSKIVINIHRDQEHYFEWHRLVQMGIWQRALVLTETVTETPPFVAGRDYVQATLDEMPRLIDYYLRDPRGIAEAEQIRNSGHERLKASCSLPRLMQEVWAPFLNPA